jgi:hypothetical protein
MRPSASFGRSEDDEGPRDRVLAALAKGAAQPRLHQCGGVAVASPLQHDRTVERCPPPGG